jgi:hypothetical protein
METDKKMKIAVVTTFHEAGLKTYAQRMIDTFCQNWPQEITLHVYPEKCNPIVRDHSRVTLTDLDSVQDLINFKTKWKNVPKANGDVSSDPVRSKRRDSGKGFKWDAVRFAHKVYSIFHCAKNTDADILVWMDADTICHSPISVSQLTRLIPADKDICFLGRRGKFSECGLYSMNLRSEAVQLFLKRFQWLYDDAENGIFQQDEWHDSFIFDIARKHSALNELDWSSHLIKGEGHPLINSEWGAYLDHLKGDRKTLGQSKRTDLLVKRVEPYWQQFR